MAGFDVNSILKLVAGDGIAALGKSAKADEGQVKTLVSAAVPLLIGKMQDNTASEAGAASLNAALNEHKGDDISDVASFLTNADSADGQKILGHILGDDQSAATKALAKKSGLSGSQVTKILALLAPLLLTMLGNNKKDDDGSSLGSLLGGLLGSSQSSGLGGMLLGSLLGGSKPSGQSAQGSSGLLGGLLGNLFGGSDKDEEEEEKPQSASSGLGGLTSLAMNLFGDSEALEEEKPTSVKKPATAKKTGTTAKKTGTTAKKSGTTAKKTGSTKKSGK